MSDISNEAFPSKPAASLPKAAISSGQPTSKPPAAPAPPGMKPPMGGGRPAPGQQPPAAAGGATGGTGKAPPVINQKIPESPFHSGLEDKLPELDLTPLDDLKTKITAEYCLEAAARVLEDLSEKQEDPLWSQQYIALADEWKNMAEMLIMYKVQQYQLQGEAILKQQEMYFQRDLHAQTLAQNDQMHMQKMTQTQQMHDQKVKASDEQNQLAKKRSDEEHTMKKKQMDDHHKVNLDLTKKKAALTLKQQQDKARQQAAAKKSASQKPAPKKSTS